MSTKEDRAYRARQIRYKKAALAILQRDSIEDELYEIGNECGELEWAVEDDETLLDVFDGDTDEIREFRFMFSDLSYNCERLQTEIRDGYVTEHFDDFFVGTLGAGYKMVGYDGMEEDYYQLTSFEAELAKTVSGKRLMGLTKETLIAVAGQCIGIMMCFLDIRHSYDCLKTSFDALRDDRAEMLKSVRSVEEAYEKWADDPSNYAYDRWLSHMPDRVWVE